MKVKVSEASGIQLDWMVAKCAGVPVHWDSDEDAFIFFDREEGGERNFVPSNDWAQGGPIIEREKMMVDVTMDESVWVAQRLYPDRPDGEDWFQQTGPTPLIAAMRCYVESKLGDEVEVPDDLV